jgi:hypothetical protein
VHRLAATVTVSELFFGFSSGTFGMPGVLVWSGCSMIGMWQKKQRLLLQQSSHHNNQTGTRTRTRPAFNDASSADMMYHQGIITRRMMMIMMILPPKGRHRKKGYTIGQRIDSGTDDTAS